jgi:sugar lactone lactonase YvrE
VAQTGSGRGRRRPAAIAVVAVAAFAVGGSAPALADTPPDGIISTVAGGVGGPGPATKVAIYLPCSVTSAGGSLYVGDGLVQQVDEATGWLTTPAGGVRSGALSYQPVPPQDGGPASQAGMGACGTAVDPAGNLVIADSHAREIRVVAAAIGTFYGVPMTAGDVYAVAGTGVGTKIAGNGKQALQATLSNPVAVAVDQAGNLVVADAGPPSGNSPAEVRVVAGSTGTFYGQQMTAGNIYVVAGRLGSTQISGDGGPAVSAGLGAAVVQVQVDPAGNLVLADAAGNSIRVVAAQTGTYYGVPMTAGDIYTVAGGAAGFSGDGGPAMAAGIGKPLGVALDGAGNLVIADTGNNRVRVVAESTGTFYGTPMTAGDIYTVGGCGSSDCTLGDGGPALAARLVAPDGVTVDDAGNIVVAERGQGLVSTNRRVRAIAASSGTFYGQQMTAGDMYTVAGDGFKGLSGDAAPATQAVMYSTSDRMAVDSAGNLVIAAGENNRIRVLAATTGTFYGVSMTAGDIYAVAGSGHFPYAGDGGPATKAGLNFPDGLAIDAHGNLVIADEGNNRVRVVAATAGTFYGVPMKANHIYTVAGDGQRGYAGDGGPATGASLSVVSGLSVDAAGNLVIADDGNNVVRVVAEATGTFYGVPMTAGDIYTVAGDGTAGFAGDGGPALGAELDQPKDVTVDGAGNLLVADQRNNRVRVVAASTGTFYGVPMTAGDIYTVAGNGTAGFAGDGGPAAASELHMPTDVITDGAGNLLIADQYNDRVRVIAATTGTFYGVPMTAGDIYTIAGTGPAGYAGDGGLAVSAMLFGPTGLAVNSQGDLYVGDFLRIRMITP